MLDFDEALGRILAAGAPLERERIPLSAACGRVLAEDLYAHTPLPAFDYSAMDGYAVSAEELHQPFPRELPISGEARAGSPRASLAPGTAVRIYTGAAIPVGADSVVLQENTTRAGDRVTLLEPAQSGDNLRRTGADLALGARALQSGTRLGPFQLGLVAALDSEAVTVTRRPRVLLATTGDELRPPGSPRRDGSIPDSNSIALSALSSLAGAEARLGARLPDEVKTATAVLADLLGKSDVLVTVGGVSVGDHDIVREALTQAGATLEFWKVAIKPGKPFAFGRAGRTLILGLPGNPVSAQVTFALFGIPLLRALQGDRQTLPPRFRARLATAMRQKPGRLGIYRGRLDGGCIHLDANQASGATTSLAYADCLVFVPKDLAECAPGSELDAIRLNEL